MSPDIAFDIGLFAGWLAIVVFMVWPEQKHCTCCSRAIAKSNNRKHK